MNTRPTVLSITFACCFSIVSGQTTGDYRSATTGTWGTASTWEEYNGSTWDAASTAPGASDNVFIQNGHTVTLSANGSCKDLHLNITGAVLAVGTNTLELNGKLRAFSGAEDVIPGTSSTSPASGCITTTGGGKVKMVGTARNIAEFDEWGPTTTDFDFEIALNSNQMAVMTTDLSAKSWNVTSGNLNCGSFVLSGPGNFTLGSGVTLIIGSVDGITSTGPDGNIQVDGTRTYSTGANYDYVGVTDQVTGDGLPSSVEHCSLQSGVILTLTNPVTFNGSLQVIDGTVADNGNQISAGASAVLSVSVDGTLRLGSNAGVTTFPAFPFVTLDEGSTVTYAGAVIDDQIVSTAPSYHNLRFYGGSKKIVGSGTLTINGTWYVGSYTDLFTYDPTVNVGGDVGTGFANNINMGDGNLNVTGNWSAPEGTSGGPGAVVFNGDSPTISNTVFENVTFNLSGNATLTGAVYVNGVLTLTSGKVVTTNTNLLILSATSSVSGGSAASYVNGPVRGDWQGSTLTMVLPVGKGEAYRPLEITLTTPSDPQIRVEVFNADAGGSSALNAISPVRYYQTALISGTASSGGTVKINFGADDGVNSGQEANLVVAQSSTAGGTYTSLGQSANSSTSVTSASYNPASGDFLILGSTANNPLPVQIASFSASANRLNAELRWRTESEVENHGFEIERRVMEDGRWEMGNGNETTNQRQDETTNQRQNESTNQRHSSPFTLYSSPWATIGFVPGAGTSSSPREYSFVDKPDQPGRYAYRIKQIDFNGSFTYTSSLEVEVGLAPLEFTLSHNYPNPFNPSTTIDFTLPEDGRVKLAIYNTLGEEVATLVNEERKAGVYQQIVFDASRLATGLYMSRLEFKEKHLVRKMILTK